MKLLVPSNLAPEFVAHPFVRADWEWGRGPNALIGSRVDCSGTSGRNTLPFCQYCAGCLCCDAQKSTPDSVDCGGTGGVCGAQSLLNKHRVGATRRVARSRPTIRESNGARHASLLQSLPPLRASGLFSAAGIEMHCAQKKRPVVPASFLHFTYSGTRVSVSSRGLPAMHDSDDVRPVRVSRNGALAS